MRLSLIISLVFCFFGVSPLVGFAGVFDSIFFVPGVNILALKQEKLDTKKSEEFDEATNAPLGDSPLDKNTTEIGAASLELGFIAPTLFGDMIGVGAGVTIGGATWESKTNPKESSEGVIWGVFGDVVARPTKSPFFAGLGGRFQKIPKMGSGESGEFKWKQWSVYGKVGYAWKYFAPYVGARGVFIDSDFETKTSGGTVILRQEIDENFAQGLAGMDVQILKRLAGRVEFRSDGDDNHELFLGLTQALAFSGL